MNWWALFFLPRKNASNAKKWIAHSESAAKGDICIDEGARKAFVVGPSQPACYLLV